MIWVVFALSLLFTGIGFLINSANADFLLAGYNTMSPEQRKNVDLPAYLKVFKKFHIFLGLSFLVLGLGLYFFAEETVLIAFITIYPILAYLVLIIYGFRFDKNPSGFKRIASVLVILVSLGLVIYLMFEGNQEHDLIITADSVQVKGMYGEQIYFDDIAAVKLLDQLPEISKKSNGFAMGSVRKGYFKTAGNEKVKLLLHGDQLPLIFIQKTDGNKFYFSSKSSDNRSLYQILEKQVKPKND
ncbi:MAG: DUF3784 domain-containing protein [Lutimonas sp.]